MVNNRTLFYLLFLAISCAAGFILFKKDSSKKESLTFVVGTAAGYAPFVSINQHGEYEGFDIDVAHEVATVLGKRLVIKDLGSMSALFTALDQGSIDAIIWGLSITQDRLKKVAMIHYQGAPTTSYPLIFWNAIPKGVRTIANMKGKTVCVEPASSQEAVLQKYPAITMLATEKVDDALLNIQYAKADAALVEPAIAKKFKNKFPEIQTLDVPLAEENQEQGVGIVVTKQKTELIDQIQKAVEALKTKGTITALEQKWGIS
jgi:polar amino acid transport system substrate-binding protein